VTRRAPRLLALVATIGACSARSDDPLTLSFVADPGPAGEAYLCFGFDAAVLEGSDLGRIEIDEPHGAVSLHHVALYASPLDYSVGPVGCERMPDEAVPLHVWATGSGPLAFPADIELVVPEGTRRLIVQAHALRVGDGAAAERQIVLTPRSGATHRAGWIPLGAPTPALRPHHVEESTATCVVAEDVHLISTWPHMHKAGTSFRGSVAGADAFVTVSPWQFEAQHAYEIDVELARGESIETHCEWRNDTDVTILPGPSIFDEMCGQSLMAWPVEAAHCE
jgi:hypothetical protein